jgi:uncharacterized protein YkwD
VRTRLAALTLVTLVLACVAVFTGGALAASQPARSISAANQLEVGVLAELNAVRRAHGLQPLRLAPSLSSAADSHSRAMARYGFFSHSSRDGSEFSKRVGRFYGAAGHRSWSVGENLLWASPTVAPAAALRLWMASPGHRKNILTPGWREIGLSAVTAASAPGVFGNRQVTIITTDFGARS